MVSTLNEAQNIPHVLPRIPTWVDEILIVDGHSSDGTVELIRKICPRARILFQSGKGKGDAIKLGVRHAVGDLIITLDADGETDPAEIRSFVDSLATGHDIAKGSRLASGRPRRMPFYRWLGNQVLVVTFNLMYGTRFTDICSGFNGFWRDAFLRLPLPYDNCEMEQQMIARAHKRGMRIAEVPHSCEGRLSGESKIFGVKQGFVDWFVIIVERFCA